MLIRRKKTPGRSKWLNRRRKVTGGWPAVLFDDMRRAAEFCILIFLGLAFFFYIGDASRRSRAGAWKTELSVGDAGRYLAKYADLSQDDVLLRIYDNKSGEILAERTFNAAVPVSLIWAGKEVSYTTNDQSWFYDGSIRLPPTWMDRVLAHLP